MTTLKHLQGTLFEIESDTLTSSPEAFPAKTSLWRESKRVCTESAVDSTLTFSELLPKSDLDSAFWRTSLISTITALTPCLAHWKRRATPLKHTWWVLMTSAHHTDENESLSLERQEYPTPRANKVGGVSSPHFSPTLEQVVKTWSTPNTLDHMKPRTGEVLEKALRRGQEAGVRRERTGNLRENVMFPTPVAHDAKDAPTAPSQRGRGTLPLTNIVGGLLNPAWVEQLQGFPTGWTDVSLPVRTKHNTSGKNPARQNRKKAEPCD